MEGILNRRGFTLIEMLVAVVIVGIIAITSLNVLVSGEEITGTVMKIQELPGTYNEDRAFSVKLKCNPDIITFSAVDRQWATVEKDERVTAKIYKYAWFHFGKAGTYYNGRLLKNYGVEGE